MPTGSQPLGLSLPWSSYCIRSAPVICYAVLLLPLLLLRLLLLPLHQSWQQCSLYV
jgi:hypothetical protein